MARRRKHLEPIDDAARRLLDDAVQRSGLTHKEIAQRMGMSQNRVSIILRGDTPPASVGELAMIAHAIGLSVSVLIDGAERRVSESVPRIVAPDEFGLAASRHEIEDSPDAP